MFVVRSGIIIAVFAGLGVISLLQYAKALSFALANKSGIALPRVSCLLKKDKRIYSHNAYEAGRLKGICVYAFAGR